MFGSPRVCPMRALSACGEFNEIKVNSIPVGPPRVCPMWSLSTCGEPNYDGIKKNPHPRHVVVGMIRTKSRKAPIRNVLPLVQLAEERAVVCARHGRPAAAGYLGN